MKTRRALQRAMLALRAAGHVVASRDGVDRRDRGVGPRRAAAWGRVGPEARPDAAPSRGIAWTPA
jgi:hypothetical protein